MDKNDVAEVLFSKDTKENYEKFKLMEALCDGSDELYKYFDIYLKALDNESSCVRARGFKLIIKNAKWDINNKINNHLNKILFILDDAKPTVVRQCLSTILSIKSYKKELIPSFLNKLNQLDYMKYKESMQGLIKKDIDKVITYFNEI